MVVANRTVGAKVLRMKAENDLLLALDQQYSRQIIDQIPAPMAVKSEDFKYIFINRAAEDLFGLKQKDVEGKKDSDLFPADQAVKFQAMNLRVSELQDIAESEELITTRAGSCWVKLIQKPLFDQTEDQLIGYLMLFEDIHEQKVELKKVSEQKARLVQQVDEFEAFSKRVAHDLRDPLGACLAFVQLMKEQIDGQDDLLDSCDRLETILTQTHRIITGLYELSGMSGSNLLFQKEPLTAAVNEAITALHLHDNDADITIECPHEFRYSKNLFPQVFQNLIANSIKYSNEDATPKIHIQSRINKNGHLLVSVEDDGPGIPERFRRKVFEAHQRMHSDAIEGIGLGLNLVMRIAKVHGGTIRADASSKLGGARFTMNFPPEP